ncbi:MAG: hypothetical protein ACFCUH_00330 [Flavobacteriales bacterium]
MTQLQFQSFATALVIVWCTSCGTNSDSAASFDAIAETQASEVVDAGELTIAFDIEGVGFSGSLPDELNYVSGVEVENGYHGAAKVVHVGDSFTMHVTKEVVSLDELKADLAGNGLFDVVFFDEGDASFFYELVLPDGRSAGHHYLRLMTDERGATYVMRTSDERQHGYFVTQLASRTINSLKIEP